MAHSQYTQILSNQYDVKNHFLNIFGPAQDHSLSDDMTNSIQKTNVNFMCSLIVGTHIDSHLSLIKYVINKFQRFIYLRELKLRQMQEC